MTSHVRHRRTDIATDPAPAPLEPGELAVNTANRQIVAGLPDGQPVALLAVRYFDERSQYAENDFVVQDGDLWSARADVPPGPFTAEQWRKASTDPVDPTDLSAYLQKAGGTMSGPLVLYGAPQADLEAATKKYVDDATPPPPPPPPASDVPVTPVGNIATTNVQDALAELDTEKVAKAGDTMTGHLTLSADPVDVMHAVPKAWALTQMNDAANAAASFKVSKAGDTMSGELKVNADIYSSRGPTTGAIFLGNNGLHYLYFDGTKYILPAGGLDVGGVINNSGANINGTLNANQTANLNGATNLHSDGYFGAGAPSKLQIYGDSAYPTIAFHAPGYFGANFGMNTDGNFYMGGWSHGAGVYYKFLTTRDGAPVTSHRMVQAGAYQHYTGSGVIDEPYAGASVTGSSGVHTQDGYNFYHSTTYRQHQILINGNWYAVGYVG